MELPKMKTRPTQPIKHIDRDELFINLESRIKYLHSFLDFNSSTVIHSHFFYSH